MPVTRFLLPSIACLALSSAWSADFRVGAARVNITPPSGTAMGGFYRFRGVGGVLDPLFAKTIVLEQDGVHAALIVLDMSGTTHTLVKAARERVEKECGIPAGHVMISATHTHSGPQLPRGNLMDTITKVDTPERQTFVNTLPGLIARSVSEAKARLAPCRALAASGQCEGIAFNRRVLRDGQTQAIWQPAKIDPAKERPAGPVDPEVGLCVWESVASPSMPVAALVNFAMHPTSVGGGVQVSADYPGVLTRLLSVRHGQDMVAVFANGACGNINHGDYIAGRRRSTLELGTALADACTEAWPARQQLKLHTPRVAREMVKLQRRQFTEAQITQAKELMSTFETKNPGTVPMAEAVCILETADKRDRNVPLEVEVQVIAFADEMAVVSLPGEIFVELGLAIKKASPFKHTIIAELANGSMGYVPNREAYPQGNYEVVSARGEAGSGERLVETALKLLKSVR